MSVLDFLDVDLDVWDFGNNYIDFSFPIKLQELLQDNPKLPEGNFHYIRLVKSPGGFHFCHLVAIPPAFDVVVYGVFESASFIHLKFCKSSIRKYIQDLLVSEGLA